MDIRTRRTHRLTMAVRLMNTIRAGATTSTDTNMVMIMVMAIHMTNLTFELWYFRPHLFCFYVADFLFTKPEPCVHSPITPSYDFARDAHFEDHHTSSHVPNAHDHVHIHDEAHEGHSHNMRGVFLHVMAVCSRRLSFRQSDS